MKKKTVILILALFAFVFYAKSQTLVTIESDLYGAEYYDIIFSGTYSTPPDPIVWPITKNYIVDFQLISKDVYIVDCPYTLESYGLIITPNFPVGAQATKFLINSIPVGSTKSYPINGANGFHIVVEKYGEHEYRLWTNP